MKFQAFCHLPTDIRFHYIKGMNNRIGTKKPVAISMPPHVEPEEFTDAKAAVQALIALYERNTQFLRDGFDRVAKGEVENNTHFRAFYPEVRLSTSSYAQIDSRLRVAQPGAMAEHQPCMRP